MSISQKSLVSGEKITLSTLSEEGISLTLSPLGASVVSLVIPSPKKGACDICLGYSTPEAYTQDTTFQGATIGRFANRISGCAFTLNGKTYRLYDNDGGNSLHGGRRNFSRRVWESYLLSADNGSFVTYKLDSIEGDEGYPGRLKASVTYGLTKSHEFIAEYNAELDAPSPVNLTNHTYFNLAGEGSGDILSHRMRIYASSYVEVDARLIPTGRLLPVADGPFDFREQKTIGRDIAATENGYDHCFIIDGKPGTLRPCAEVYEESSGIMVEVSTTHPGCQLYTGNFLNGLTGKHGSVYNKYAGFCLETQHLPDSPNRPEFPSAIFGHDRPYHEKTVFKFSW
ncbi:MAG: galactose mutarotase [Spirochaetaceae bacterium]|jgi:aldose 1-epimerase|nr:galactose mutarotase [Spirochaetaceae bacterium]